MSCNEIVIETKQIKVEKDDITNDISLMFDYSFDGISTFAPPKMPVPGDFKLGLIVGPSGSGKSTLLRHFGVESIPKWDEKKSIASHFSSASDAIEKLSAAGFNSIPSWMRPYHVLSTGEKFRADMARKIDSNVVIDEYTSVIDRNVAKSCSNAIRRYIDKNGLTGIVFASCHYDIIEWLRPDWVFDTATEKFSARRLERPTITVNLTPCTYEVWPLFSKHHYLTGNINKGARMWLAEWDGVAVGFTSMIAFPNQHFKNAWREHRTVVLPDFQGLGIGVRISDALGEICLKSGLMFFSKTSHPRMGEYRNTSILWRATSKNNKRRKDYLPERDTKEKGHRLAHAHRLCFSHEYIGNQ